MREARVANETYDRGVSPATTITTCAGTNELKIDASTNHGLVTNITLGSVTELLDYSDTAQDLPDQAFGELRHQVVKFGPSTVLMDIVYDAGAERRDALGRIRFKTESFRNLQTPTSQVVREYEYEYEERNHLENVLRDSLAHESFTYDPNGNRETYSGPNGSIADGATTYDDQDRLLTYGAATFTYTPNGEIRTKTVAGAVTTYTYDARGNLYSVQRPSGAALITYLVDGRGRRVGKKVGSTITKRWVYGNGLSPLAELNAAGEIVARFVYGTRPNIPDFVVRGGTTFRIISDHLGSPRMAVNVASISQTTDIPYRADYSAFGEVSVPADALAFGLTSASLDWLPFGFAGGLYDRETGLVRFGARDYDPSVGRWVSKDPIRFEGGQPNIYAYVGNDPVNRRDPAGLAMTGCDWGVGVVGLTSVCAVECYGFSLLGPPGVGAAIGCSLVCAAYVAWATDGLCHPPPPPSPPSLPPGECDGNNPPPPYRGAGDPPDDHCEPDDPYCF